MRDRYGNSDSGGHHSASGSGGGFGLGCGQRDGHHRDHNPALFAMFLDPDPDETDGARTRARRRRSPQLHRRRS